MVGISTIIWIKSPPSPSRPMLQGTLTISGPNWMLEFSIVCVMLATCTFGRRSARRKGPKTGPTVQVVTPLIWGRKRSAFLVTAGEPANSRIFPSILLPSKSPWAARMEAKTWRSRPTGDRQDCALVHILFSSSGSILMSCWLPMPAKYTAGEAACFLSCSSAFCCSSGDSPMASTVVIAISIFSPSWPNWLLSSMAAHWPRRQFSGLNSCLVNFGTKFSQPTSGILPTVDASITSPQPPSIRVLDPCTNMLES
mmetsp:Transcript_88440/g.211135  ORF Transcript_88440/g.211135 Transcript_88440/m.211135 type:complete len:254 (+) Transcript_88440:1508-2269(+)